MSVRKRPYSGPDPSSDAAVAGQRYRTQRGNLAITTGVDTTHIDRQLSKTEADFEDYCKSKADPYDEAWGDD